MDKITLVLSGKERELLITVLNEYVDIQCNYCSADAIDDEDDISSRMKNGLGSIFYKLYKGCKGQEYYKEYKKGR